MSETILVALVTGVLALLGTWLSNNKNAALIAYRLEQLEDKVSKHNQVVERTYRLEERSELHEEKLKAAGRRLAELERRTET